MHITIIVQHLYNKVLYIHTYCIQHCQSVCSTNLLCYKMIT